MTKKRKIDVKTSISNKRMDFQVLITGQKVQEPVPDDILFEGLAGEFALEATKDSEADPMGILAAFLVRFSAELGRNPFYMVGDTRHYGNIFAVLVGKTSKARKGTCTQPVMRVFEKLDPEKRCREVPGPLSSGEGLIFAVRDMETRWDKKEQNEIITDPGVNDKRLCVISDEFASALEAIRRDANTLSTTLRCFWDHGNAAPLTKTTRTKATGAHVSILGHITVQELKEKMPKNEFFSGLANRFIWIYVERKKLVPKPKGLATARLEEWAERIEEVVKFGHNLDRVKFTKSGRQIWVKEYPNLTRDDDSLAGVMSARSEALAIRLALIFAILDLSDRIRPEHIKRAIALVEYSRATCHFVFPFQISDKAQSLFWNLQNSKQKRLTRSEIQNTVFHRNLSAFKIDQVIQELLAMEMIKVNTLKKGSRSVEVIEIV